MSAIVGLPQVQLEIGGGYAVDPRSLIAVRVQQRLMLPSLCELTFSDPPGALPDIQPGMGLRVSLNEYSVPLFAGEVTAIEYIYGARGEQEIRVRGYDALVRLRRHQSIRSHIQVTAADLARQFSRDAGFDASIDADGPIWRWVLQHGQNDLDFLGQAAERAGLVFYVFNGVLRLFTLDGLGEPLPVTVGGNVLEARFTANHLYAYEQVRTAGWHPQDFTLHSAGSGADGGDVFYHVNAIVADAEHARAFSAGQLKRRQAAERSVWAVIDGHPLLQPGTVIRMNNAAPAVNGAYVITSANHTIDSTTGYITEIDTQPPTVPPQDDHVTATIGVVSDINGDDGRVRVLLKAIEARDPIETDWLSVVADGAGADKGIIALPEVGDTVLVLIVQAFPGQGVVIGGVYSTGSLPDNGIVNGRRQRYTFRTSGGQLIQLDDSAGRLRLQNRDGSLLEMSPGSVRLIAGADLEIAAPGHQIRIVGRQIDFDEG